jgi:hypothetical protein
MHCPGGVADEGHSLPSADGLKRDLAQLASLVTVAAARPEVRREVIRNYSDNTWWPRRIGDWRLRMAIAGWSTRVAYRGIRAYQQVVCDAEAVSFDALCELSDAELARLLRPIGLTAGRIAYLRSLAALIHRWDDADTVPTRMPNDTLIQQIADQVLGAGFKVAQCAALYAKGYHCGIIPVDSGMVQLLGPCIGMRLPSGTHGHEVMRRHLERLVCRFPETLRAIATATGYDREITLPISAPPTWWVHLVLIYFKRRFCNQHQLSACPFRNHPSLSGQIGTMCNRHVPKLHGNYVWQVDTHLPGDPRG